MPVIPFPSSGTRKAKARTLSKRRRTPTLPQESAPLGLSREALFYFDMSGVLRLTGDSAANGGSDDPVVLSGESERAIRAMMSEFGFPRLPLTIAEFYTVVEYCQMLDTAAGFSMLPGQPEMQAMWQAVSIAKYKGFHPEHAQAIELYCTGQKEALSRLHASCKTMESLAKSYGEFDNEPPDDEPV